MKFLTPGMKNDRLIKDIVLGTKAFIRMKVLFFKL